MRYNSHHAYLNSQEYDREYAKGHPENSEHKRARNLKLRYGISVEEYDRLFQLQNGRCAACGEVFTSNLCVDHDHVTGKIRGLLCSDCNLVLGLVKDEPERLAKLQKYLLS